MDEAGAQDGEDGADLFGPAGHGDDVRHPLQLVQADADHAVESIPHQVPVVIDEALLRHERVWAACGDGNSVFEVDIRELAERSGAAVVPLAAEDAPQATG